MSTEPASEPRQLTKARAALAEQTRRDLRRWATLHARRDQLVREAADRGLGVNEITRLLAPAGIAKTTVIRILRQADATGQLADDGPMAIARAALGLDRKCPRCGAKVSEPCHTASGAHRGQAHTERGEGK